MPEEMAAAVEVLVDGRSATARGMGMIPPSVVPVVVAAARPVGMEDRAAALTVARVRVVPPGVVPQEVAAPVGVEVTVSPGNITAAKEQSDPQRESQ